MFADRVGLLIYDLVVVGAGPSGSVAATIAARLGLKTLIFRER